MPVVPTRTFAGWLRRLDGPRFAAFVADLHATRGVGATVRDDGTVALDDGRVLATVSGRRRLRTPRVAADADAVVAATVSPRLARLAARRDLAVVDASDLRDLALYGIDRSETERLFAEYFDASPVVAAPEPTDSAASRLARVGDTSAASVAAVVLVGLVVAALLGPFGPGVAPADDDAARAGSGPVVVGASDPASDGSEDELFPPGIGATGVVDAETLAAAHADSVAGRSYRLIVHESGTRGWNDRVWRGVWQQAEVENPRHFRYTVTGYVESAAENDSARGVQNGTAESAGDTDGDGDELVQYTAYADGELVYVRTELRNESFYRYPVYTDENGHGLFERRAARNVERYLDAPETTVTREPRDLYPFHVVATGTPPSLPDAENVSDYRAEATVGTDGFVSLLIVSYDRTRGNETRTVTYRLEYATMDRVNVSRPTWYDRAVGETESPSTRSSETSNESADEAGTATETAAETTTPATATETPAT
ncbi:hypothetical protein [Halogeometricum limi]|uniref:Uncharacterized protein n=1 Tax=Halogeometricum limi TaxID=555875 RepID=A0A1I6IQC7_9EURY|nr:hypothetical protein [Halogeometricum limi]SFR68944.1 hypothetical protein SAMN04488124_3503 [Halogeometricum limi]